MLFGPNGDGKINFSDCIPINIKQGEQVSIDFDIPESQCSSIIIYRLSDLSKTYEACDNGHKSKDWVSPTNTGKSDEVYIITGWYMRGLKWLQAAGSISLEAGELKVMTFNNHHDADVSETFAIVNFDPQPDAQVMSEVEQQHETQDNVVTLLPIMSTSD